MVLPSSAKHEKCTEELSYSPGKHQAMTNTGALSPKVFQYISSSNRDRNSSGNTIEGVDELIQCSSLTNLATKMLI